MKRRNEFAVDVRRRELRRDGANPLRVAGRICRAWGAAVAGMGLMLLCGCGGGPNKANIELRKEIDSLNQKVQTVERERAADQAEIRGLRASRPTVPSLPEDRLNQLFTTHGIRLERLTGQGQIDPADPKSQGLKVYVVPFDQNDDALKAAGTFTVDAFDLAMADHNHIGHWAFDLEQTKQAWYGGSLMYNYVLKCPWQTTPAHRGITIRVTFSDALTGREFTVERLVTLESLPTTNSTQGAASP